MQDFTHLDDAELTQLHKSLHTDPQNPAVVQAHHLTTVEMLNRGLEHGHEDDVWSTAVIEVAKSENVPVREAFSDVPAYVSEEVMNSLGNPDVVTKTTVLSVDGYTIRYDSDELRKEFDESRLNQTQQDLYEMLESYVESNGAFEPNSGANGAHYMDVQPFNKDGMNCANCVFYEGGQACEIVTGLIKPEGICKFWIIPEDLLSPKVLKHLAGQHDQSSHGSWAGTSQDSGKPDHISFNDETYVKGRDSLWEHLVPDGKGGYKLSPERQKLHQEIVAKHLEGKQPSTHKTYVLMGGGGGSGKGTVQKNPQSMQQAIDAGIRYNPDAVLIDADAIKAMIPEFLEMNKAGNKEESAGFVHEESSMLAKKIEKEAFARSYDVTLDGTGDSKITKLEKKINTARENGYEVHGWYVSCGLMDAWERNMRRAINNPDRGLVPAFAFLEAHKSVSDIIPSMAGKFDTFTLFDTSGTSPIHVASASFGGKLNIHNQKAYNEFRKKALSKLTPDYLTNLWNQYRKDNKKGE